MSNKSKYNIIGCGVIGLTTGICLNLSGYDTKIVTESIPNFKNYLNKSDTKIATEYAAASVKPSSIDYNRQEKFINQILSDSIEVFDFFTSIDSVNYTRHYIGGDEFNKPFYSDTVINYRENTNNPPGEVNESARFKCHFIDMPQYIKLLIDTYKNTGGKIREKKINTLDDIQNPINCTGLGSKELISDHNMKKLKGYLAYVETGNRIKKNGNIISYAYNIDGKSIYCYTQKDRMILGGTVIEDDSDENFEFYDTKLKSVPKHIIYDNRSIISDYFGTDIFEYDIYGVCGYRPYRIGGLRIEKDNQIIHNYGHGGCGVTLSWGSALKVCEIIEENKSEVKNKLKRKIQS